MFGRLRRGPATQTTQAPVPSGKLPVAEHPIELVQLQARKLSVVPTNKILLASALSSPRTWTNELPKANPRRRAPHKAAAQPAPTIPPTPSIAVPAADAAGLEAQSGEI
jgi:hypothetical protein